MYVEKAQTKNPNIKISRVISYFSNTKDVGKFKMETTLVEIGTADSKVKGIGTLTNKTEAKILSCNEINLVANISFEPHKVITKYDAPPNKKLKKIQQKSHFLSFLLSLEEFNLSRFPKQINYVRF